jgi:hypothetical protein
MVLASSVILQYLQDIAVRYAALSAIPDHPLELPLQGLQALDASIDVDQMRPCNRIDARARHLRSSLEFEQCHYGFNLETEFARVSDEAKSLYGLPVIEAPIGD